MSEGFDYNEIFMGVMPKKKKSYKISFTDDYRLKRLTEAVKIKEGKMLDIGCGGGLLTESLRYYYPKTKIYGCDVSQTAIVYAKKFGSGKVSYGVIKNKKLPYKDNTFDVCLCLDVLEHVPDDNFFLKEVKRITKNGGKFFMVLPCEGQPFTYTWLFQKIRFGDKLTFKNWGHIHPEYTHKYVETLLRKHNFSIDDKAYSEHFFYQLVNFFTYFLPKEIMDCFLGKNAAKYYDRGVVEKEVCQKREDDFFDYIRKVWLSLGGFLNRSVTALEVESLKKVSVTAWKINLLAQVNKKNG